MMCPCEPRAPCKIQNLTTIRISGKKLPIQTLLWNGGSFGMHWSRQHSASWPTPLSNSSQLRSKRRRSSDPLEPRQRWKAGWLWIIVVTRHFRSDTDHPPPSGGGGGCHLRPDVQLDNFPFTHGQPHKGDRQLPRGGGGGGWGLGWSSHSPVPRTPAEGHSAAGTGRKAFRAREPSGAIGLTNGGSSLTHFNRDGPDPFRGRGDEWNNA